MEDHPGVTFRDGPTGRRAALVGGSDVWEVIAALRASGLTGEKALAAIAKSAGLSTAQVRTATGYYADFGDEIDARVSEHLDAADEAEARWRRERAALG